MKKQPVRRITADLGPDSYKRLTKLQRFLECRTMIGVITRALELLELVVHALDKGFSVVMRDQDGNEIPIKILGLNRPVDEGFPPKRTSATAV